MWPWKAVPSSPSAWEAEVRDSHRLFLCARCSKQVHICSDCDRGNIYCSEACAAIRRRESVREAGRRYQQGPPGRRSHARRQRAYVARRRRKVTHQGPDGVARGAEPLPGDGMRLSEGGPVLAGELELPHDAYPDPSDETLDDPLACPCDLCGRPVSAFARLDFLTTPCVGGWP